VSPEPATDDRGDGDPALLAALATGEVVAIRAAMLTARLLVPIVAFGDESDAAEMAVPRLVGADGRHALPVFSSYDALRAWRPDARPVPMPGEQAISGAVGEGYAAVVLDVAGPITHVVELPSPPDQAQNPNAL
jgi:SseB protein N-terminal domain